MVNFSTAQHFATSAAPSPAGRDGLLGRIFNNRFRIQGLIARGGMGKVYRAVQVPLGRPVALKVLNPAYTSERSVDFHRRFFLEASIAARLTHPHTVTVFDFGCTDDGIYYMAMELLEGVALRTAMGHGEVFAPRRSLHIAGQIAQAVREAHGLGAVHRDLKPANIFLLRRGADADFVKVLDFGLVKHATSDDGITQPGKFLGSPGYMAPEQIRGQAIDVRTDIYALGVLMYEMLTGHPPFVRSNAFETMMAHVHDPVPPLRQAAPAGRLPERLEELVQRCLQKNPQHRFANMDALTAALGELTGETTDFLGTTQVSIVRRTPVRLEEEEASGWAVRSASGIFTLHAADTKRHAAAPEPIVDAAIEAPTLAMDLPTVVDACPSASALPLPIPTPSVPARRPAARGAVWRRLAAVGAALLCSLIGPDHRAQNQAARGGRIDMVLGSTPPGATVYVGADALCPRTPCDVAWTPPADMPKGGVVSLRFVLSGYDEFIVTRRLAGPTLNVTCTLTDADSSKGPSPP